ncbi:hypothetical protein P3L10_009518 [Capsicum annuum]
MADKLIFRCIPGCMYCSYNDTNCNGNCIFSETFPLPEDYAVFHKLEKLLGTDRLKKALVIAKELGKAIGHVNYAKEWAETQYWLTGSSGGEAQDLAYLDKDLKKLTVDFSELRDFVSNLRNGFLPFVKKQIGTNLSTTQKFSDILRSSVAAGSEAQDPAKLDFSKLHDVILGLEMVSYLS